MPSSMWDLSSPTRGQTQVPCIGSVKERLPVTGGAAVCIHESNAVLIPFIRGQSCPVERSVMVEMSQSCPFTTAVLRNAYM